MRRSSFRGRSRGRVSRARRGRRGSARRGVGRGARRLRIGFRM